MTVAAVLFLGAEPLAHLALSGRLGQSGATPAMVADTLRALQADADALKANAEAARAAQASFELVRQQYLNGSVSLIVLLNAEQTYQQAEIARVQAQANRYSDTAGLFQALGGGWWNLPEATFK